MFNLNSTETFQGLTTNMTSSNTSQVNCSLCKFKTDFPASKLVHLDAHNLKWTMKNYCELYGLVEQEILVRLKK